MSSLSTTTITDSNTFTRSIDLFDKESSDGKQLDLVIHQMEIGDEGCVVWDAALVLLKYLLTPNGLKHVYRNHVIELGSGTGVVGLAASAAGAKTVTITDLPSLLPLIQHNIKENSTTIDSCREYLDTVLKNQTTYDEHKNTVVDAMPLDWTNSSDANSVCDKVISNCTSDNESCCILIADCVYYQEGMKALVSTIVYLFDNLKRSTHLLCSYEIRLIGDKVQVLKDFNNELVSNNFRVEYIKNQDMDQTYQSDDIMIMLISKP